MLVKALETKSIRGTQKHDTQKTKYTGDKNTQGCLTSTAPQLVVVSQLVHERLNTPRVFGSRSNEENTYRRRLRAQVVRLVSRQGYMQRQKGPGRIRCSRSYLGGELPGGRNCNAWTSSWGCACSGGAGEDNDGGLARSTCASRARTKDHRKERGPTASSVLRVCVVCGENRTDMRLAKRGRPVDCLD